MSVVSVLRGMIQEEARRQASQIQVFIFPDIVSLDDENAPTVPSNHPLPETVTKKLLNWERVWTLSREAQELIGLVLEAPFEPFKSSGRISRSKVKETLREAGWSWGQISRAWREVQGWVKEFY